MNRRKFLKNIGMTVAVAPIAATTVQEAAKVQEEIRGLKNYYSKRNMNIDSNYPEFFMSWDDPDGIYIRKSVKKILEK